MQIQAPDPKYTTHIEELPGGNRDSVGQCLNCLPYFAFKIKKEKKKSEVSVLVHLIGKA